MPKTASPVRLRAFTLIELLVVVAIIAILIGILLPALGNARTLSRQTRELAAAQQLMLAYALYADDNKEALIPGYLPSSLIATENTTSRGRIDVIDDEGERVVGPPAQRFPWRLAPYLEYNFEGLYKDEKLLRRYRGSGESYTYVVSLAPSLAINTVFMGGDDNYWGWRQQAIDAWGQFFARRLGNVQRPAEQLVMVSARGQDSIEGEDLPVPGWYRALPPQLRDRNWEDSYDEDQRPSDFGHVHPRYFGKAITAFLHGHCKSLSIDELDDMRIWANAVPESDRKLGDPR